MAFISTRLDNTGRQCEESKIDACGAVFVLIVTDEEVSPFYACKVDICGNYFNIARHYSRIHAVKDIYDRAMNHLLM